MSAQVHTSDLWAAGEAYERYIGRWSRLIAPRFVRWLAVPAASGWLDAGCGTGALTRAILAGTAPTRVVGVDSSDGFVAYAREHTHDARANFRLGDAQALPFADGEFDAALAGLVLNFIAQPERALREMKRVLRPGGVAAVYVWDYAGEMQLIRRFWDAARALDPKAEVRDEAHRFPMCRPERLLELFRDCGFDQADCCVLNMPTVFEDFDDYWLPFLGGQGPAPGYARALSANHLEELRERLKATLPIERDGTIHLVARAFAVRGVCGLPKPSPASTVML